MGRIYSRGKGISKSAYPHKRTQPKWVRMNARQLLLLAPLCVPLATLQEELKFFQFQNYLPKASWQSKAVRAGLVLDIARMLLKTLS